MPFYLRKIKNNRWLGKQEYPWLQEDEIPGDPLNDLGTSANELSVFVVEDENDLTSIERIAAALTANGQNIDTFGYTLIDSQTLEELGIRIRRTQGNTPDEKVNSWHCDVIELSAQKLVKLAMAMFPQAERRKRIFKKNIKKLLGEGVSAGQIDLNKVSHRKMREELDKLGTSQ
jgi:hypothetical protein